MTHAITLKSPQQRTAAKAEANTPAPVRKGGFVERCIVRIKAKRQAKKIMRSLHEAKEVNQGKRQSRTLEEFLKNF